MQTVCDGCRNLRGVAGSAHARCEGMESALMAMTLFAVGSERTPKANAHGVRMGWCMWPLDFDPIWIESCPLRLAQ